VSGQTAWGEWEWMESSLGLQVSIDTSAAGFQKVPCYFAWLNGPLSFPEIDDGEVAGVAVVMPFVSLADEKPNSFLFRVLLTLSPDLLVTTNQIFQMRIGPTKANELKWTVCWLGIEH